MSRSLATLIVDDEPLARKGLQVRLQAYDDINIVAQCANGKAALEILASQPIDLMFLDIQMPGLNGFDVLQQALAQGINLPMVVFVTAFNEFALKAFEVHALDYLLKPADEVRLAQTIEKIRFHYQNKKNKVQHGKLVRLVSDVTGNDCQQIINELENENPILLSQYSDILAIKDGSEISRVPIKDIIWIDAAGDYMCVHTDDTTHILRQTMKQLEETLDPRQFVRTHRSIIVNQHYVEKFCSQLNGEYYLILQNGKELKVSRSYKEKVKQLMSS
jgi:two-component system, LytTR family, response regulator